MFAHLATNEVIHDVLAAPAVLDITAIVVGSIFGAALAVRRSMSAPGVLVLTIATGLGGGLIRDILLQQGPPVALTDWRYLTAASITAVIAFFFSTQLARLGPVLLLLDALSLGLFAVVGAERAALLGLPPLSICLVAYAAACGGGALRDILAGEVPEILRPGVINSFAVILGSGLFVLLVTLDVPQRYTELATLIFIMGLRLIAVWRRWHAPVPTDAWRLVRPGIVKMMRGTTGRLSRVRSRSLARQTSAEETEATFESALAANESAFAAREAAHEARDQAQEFLSEARAYRDEAERILQEQPLPPAPPQSPAS